MFFEPRKIVYQSVISMPDSKTAGAVTLSSDVFSLPALYKTSLVISATDLSKITDNITIKLKGSFDNGSTWIVLGSYTDLVSGTGALTVLKEVLYAPKVKVEVAFDATGALASGHGIDFDLILTESKEETVKVAQPAIITVGATVGASATVVGSTLTASKEVPFIDKVYLVTTLDKSKATLATQALEGSIDGVCWYPVTLSSTDLTAANTIFAESTSTVGKYVRAKISTGASTGALASGHGLAMNAILTY